MKQKTKKIIAREFLLLLATILLTGLVYLILILTNLYFNNRIDSNNKELGATINQQTKFYTIPLKPKYNDLNQKSLDKLIRIYSDINLRNVIDFYKLDVDKTIFPNLIDFVSYISNPNNNKDNIQEYYFNSVDKTAFNNQNDFYFFIYAKCFKIGNNIYDIQGNQVDDFFKSHLNVTEIQSFDNKLILKNFPQLKNDTNLVNALGEYDATIKSGKYNSKKEINTKFPEFFIIEKSDKDSLEYFKNKISDIQANIYSYNCKLIDKNEINNYTLISGIIIFSLLFVIRFLIYAIIWSLKIIKQ